MPPQGGDCAAAVLLQLCVLFTRFEVKEPVSLARPPFAFFLGLAATATVCSVVVVVATFEARNSEALMMQSGLKWLWTSVNDWRSAF